MENKQTNKQTPQPRYTPTYQRYKVRNLRIMALNMCEIRNTHFLYSKEARGEHTHTHSVSRALTRARTHSPARHLLENVCSPRAWNFSWAGGNAVRNNQSQRRLGKGGVVHGAYGHSARSRDFTVKAPNEIQQGVHVIKTRNTPEVCAPLTTWFFPQTVATSVGKHTVV